MSRTLSPRSKAYRSTAQRLGFHAVCLIGWEGPRPAFFGDNKGMWPVRVVTSAKEMTAADRADLESPHVGVIVMEYVLVPSEAHAKRLKEALDEVLLGEQETQMNQVARHKWKNVCGAFEPGDDHQRAMWWGICLEEARRLVGEGSTDFPIYEEPEDVVRIVSNRARSGR